MKLVFPFPSVFLAGLLASSAAWSQGAPLNTAPSANRPAPPAPAAPAPATAPAAPVETPQMMIEQINRSLNGMAQLTGDFTQTSADGRKRTGKIYVMRPGKLRFDYNPPSQIEVVADGSSVAVIDKKVPQQDVYGIKQTPLKFLVADRIDVSRDTQVLSVRRDKDDVVLDIEDKNTLAGTSRIKIFFNGQTYALKRWTVTDPQGVPTTVQLANLNMQKTPDRQLFTINYQFNVGRQN